MKSLFIIMLSINLYSSPLDDGCRDILSEQYTHQASAVAGYIIALYHVMDKKANGHSMDVEIENVCKASIKYKIPLATMMLDITRSYLKGKDITRR